MTTSQESDPTYFSLPKRLLILLAYLAVLIPIHFAINRSSYLSLESTGLWLVCAVAFLIYSLLDAPFFAPPRQTLASSLTATLILVTMSLPETPELYVALQSIRWTGVGLALLTMISATIAIILHPHKRADSGAARLASSSFTLSKKLGKDHILYTPAALTAIGGYYHANVSQVLILTLVWLALVLLRPIELFWLFVRQLRAAQGKRTGHDRIGEIERVDSPNIVRVKLEVPGAWKPDSPHVACLPDSSQSLILPLAIQPREDSMLGTGLIYGIPEIPIATAIPGFVYRSAAVPSRENFLRNLGGEEAHAEPPQLAGVVVEDSRIGHIYFEVATGIDLQEGLLVYCPHDGQKIYYQILDARTREESISNNPFGMHRAFAIQLGIFDSHRGFLKHPWLPAMNSPVFLAGEAVDTYEPDEDNFTLGRVAETGLTVRARFSDIIEYHTAILGVTGTGKTELVFDLIRHGIALDTKIICVDLTEDYRHRLAELQPVALEFSSSRVKELNDYILGVETGQYAAADEKRELQAWLRTVTPEVEDRVDRFLDTSGPGLGIFELPEIANTRSTLWATELYLSAVFRWARSHRRLKRILIVLEEAHTVIPEQSMFGFNDRADTQAVVARMAQIALQGRKYGVGLLLVSQRTALVSKTLLSQCNTTISFAMYDKTGLDYMRSIHGEDHVNSIPNLRFLEGIAYGKAVLSDRPVIFNIPFDPSKKAASERVGRTPSNPGFVDDTDDIPF